MLVLRPYYRGSSLSGLGGGGGGLPPSRTHARSVRFGLVQCAVRRPTSFLPAGHNRNPNSLHLTLPFPQMYVYVRMYVCM